MVAFHRFRRKSMHQVFNKVVKYDAVWIPAPANLCHTYWSFHSTMLYLEREFQVYFYLKTCENFSSKYQLSAISSDNTLLSTHQQTFICSVFLRCFFSFLDLIVWDLKKHIFKETFHLQGLFFKNTFDRVSEKEFWFRNQLLRWGVPS